MTNTTDEATYQEALADWKDALHNIPPANVEAARTGCGLSAAAFACKYTSPTKNQELYTRIYDIFWYHYHPQDTPAAEPPAPFALVWDGQMGSLRRRDGFTIIATMSERTYKRIKQAQDDGADFYELKALFPKKHTVYNA